MEAPELERAEPTVHVDKLTMQAWFYFDEADKRYDKLFSTKWTFARNEDGWEHNIKNIRNFSASMGVTPEFLRPYFGAYRIASMPSRCTKVYMKMEYGGERIPEMTGKVGKFRLSWAAARMHQLWLAESMYVESIEGYQ